MSQLHEFPYPVIPVSGSVITSGQFGDLKDLAGSHSIGIYDAQTYGIATGSGNGKDFFVGYSSEHTRDALTKFWTGMTIPKKTQIFKGADVISFEYSDPQKLQNEEWVVGYDGTPSSVGLTFKKDTRYGLRITLKGSPTLRAFNKILEHEVFVKTSNNCDDNCTDGCDDGLDCVKYTTQWAENINNHPELQLLGVKAKVIHDDYAAPAKNMTKWQISVCDEGDSNALAAVQITVGSAGKVERISRVGSTSTYEVCVADGVELDDFVPTENVALAVCNVCPSGYTLVDESLSVYIVRPITPSTDLTDATAQDTFADSVATAYGTDLSISIADGDSTFVSNNGNGTATVKLNVPVGTEVEALFSDLVIVGGTNGAYCDPDESVEPIEWAETGDAYRGQRDLKMTLERPDCDGSGDRLAELEAFYANNTDVVEGSISILESGDEYGGVACADVYGISQWSKGCSEDDCFSSDVLEFNDLPGFEASQWEVVPTADADDTGTKCGLRITAGYIGTKYGDCSYDPRDKYEVEPIRMEISTVEEFAGLCDYNSMPKAKRVQVGLSERQSGEWLRREYIDFKSSYDVYAQYYNDPRWREAMDVNVLPQVDRNAYYRVYYLKYKTKRGESQFDQEPEIFETQIAFKETEKAKAQAFEAAALAAFGKFGVTLGNR